jgi:hypothetical protein
VVASVAVTMSCKREQKTVVIPHTHGSIPLSHASPLEREID